MRRSGDRDLRSGNPFPSSSSLSLSSPLSMGGWWWWQEGGRATPHHHLTFERGERIKERERYEKEGKKEGRKEGGEAERERGKEHPTHCLFSSFLEEEGGGMQEWAEMPGAGREKKKSP